MESDRHPATDAALAFLTAVGEVERWLRELEKNRKVFLDSCLFNPYDSGRLFKKGKRLQELNALHNTVFARLYGERLKVSGEDCESVVGGASHWATRIMNAAQEAISSQSEHRDPSLWLRGVTKEARGLDVEDLRVRLLVEGGLLQKRHEDTKNELDEKTLAYLAAEDGRGRIFPPHPQLAEVKSVLNERLKKAWSYAQRGVERKLRELVNGGWLDKPGRGRYRLSKRAVEALQARDML